ncbi:MAG: hypothetical protein WC088_00580 [Candidatus Izemoplasmatales bacterium]
MLMQLLYVVTDPTPFSPFNTKHLIGTFGTLLIVALILILTLVIFKKTNKRKVLQITTVILLLMEVAKQSLAIYDAGGVYPTWALPFQLCSVSIYLMPIVAFAPQKLADFFKPGCFTIGLFASLSMLGYPSTILDGTPASWIPITENWYPLISFVYHGAMVFFSLFMLFGKVYIPNFRDYPRAYLTMVGFAIIAIIANTILDTDMMFLNHANGFPFQFILNENGKLVFWGFMMILSFVVLSIPFIPALVKQLLDHNPKDNTIKSM